VPPAVEGLSRKQHGEFQQKNYALFRRRFCSTNSAIPSGEGLDEDPGKSPLSFYSLPDTVTSNPRSITQEQWLFLRFAVCSFQRRFGLNPSAILSGEGLFEGAGESPRFLLDFLININGKTFEF
jgi:hypothetical protein